MGNDAGFVESELLVSRIVGDGAVLAELVDPLAAIEPSDLVRDHFDGPIGLDEMRRAGVEHAGRADRASSAVEQVDG